MLTFSIWVLFQTSSKKARETNKKTQATRQPHQAIKGFISGRNFHNIRRQLHKKELWTVLKKHLLYNYLMSCDIYEAEFACFYNI